MEDKEILLKILKELEDNNKYLRQLTSVLSTRPTPQGYTETCLNIINKGPKGFG